MIEITGQYNTAICYTSLLEEAAAEQILAVCNQPFFAGSSIRIMPDVHAGTGCTIGTTMTITDKIVPGMVGVDIGCGMETVRLAQTSIDLNLLDAFIHAQIPSGSQIHGTPHPYASQIDLTQLRCYSHINPHRAARSIGTLGGGNHFIEAARDGSGNLYLIVHSGSRHLGQEVARYYQEEGYRALCGNARYQVEETIARLKAEGRQREISGALAQLQNRIPLHSIPKDLAYVEGPLFHDYIHDMNIVQQFAALNRKAIVQTILQGLGLTAAAQFTTTHNYIDTEHMILRKGSVSAQKGEMLLIPINMRDGSLLCIGKGNPEWNYSAPHGAGRLMSRGEARANLSMEAFRQTMEGIYTTCVTQNTLDESPMAYKGLEAIVSQIGPTAEIIERLLPIYNFKATE